MNVQDVNGIEQVREALTRAILVPSTQNRQRRDSLSPARSPPSGPKPRRFSVVSESPPAVTRIKKSGSQKLPSRSESRRASFSESDVTPILKRDEDLVGASEMVKSAAKNFRFLSLQVPEDLSVTDFSQNLLRELRVFKEAVDANGPLPLVQQKTVPQEDIKAFWNFAGQVLATQEWTQVFCELIEKMDEERKQGIFLSPREREGLARVQFKEEADELASHLMSRCTEMANGVRIVQLGELQRLLIDQRIKAFPIMVEPIKDAALNVMEEAIRDRQASIFFETVKAVKGAAREARLAWLEQAKTVPNAHLDVAGINFIAKKCKSKVTVAENKNDRDQQDLAKLIALKEKIEEVLRLYLEEVL